MTELWVFSKLISSYRLIKNTELLKNSNRRIQKGYENYSYKSHFFVLNIFFSVSLKRDFSDWLIGGKMTNETSKLIKSNVKEINQTREMKSKKIMTRIRLDQEGHHKKSTSIKFKCFEEDWIWIGVWIYSLHGSLRDSK